jgi:5'-nucleotidase
MRAAVFASLVSLVVLACGSSDGGAQPLPTAGDDGSDAGSDAPLAPASVRILAINDFHGNVEPPGGTGGMIGTTNAGGAAYLAAHLKALRTPNTVVVSSGDLSGASPLVSGLFHDEPAVLVMNALGLDLNGVGNHEFDHGRAELLRLQNGGCHPTDGCVAGQPPFPGAKFHYLAANVNDEMKQTLFRPYEIKTIDGEKIAFVGMTLEATKSIVPAKGVEGLSFENEVSTVNALVPEIKAAGASAIIVLLHQGDVPPTGTDVSGCGIEGGPLDALVSGMDKAVTVVHSAHTHQPYVCKLGGRLVTSASSFGRVITQIDLAIDRATHAVTSTTAKNVVVTRDVTPDPDVASIVATYTTLVAPLANRVVGHLTAPLGVGLGAETPIGDVIADAQLEATKADGAVIAFTNSGGIRTDLAAGTVTYAQAFAVQPFQNDLVTMDLAGADLKALLEAQFSGGSLYLLQLSDSLHYTYKSSGLPGAHVDPATITIGGAPFDAAATYRVTVSSYLAGGGDGFDVFLKGKNTKTSITDIDAFVAYLGAHDPLTPPTPSRVTAQ